MSHPVRVLATQVDHLAAQHPELIFAEFLSPPHLPEGDVLSLTYADFKNAIDRLAWWLKDQIAQLGLAKFDTILYVGCPDLRYSLMLLAAIKNNIVVLFSAPVNDTTAHLSLMQATNCKAYFYAEDTKDSGLRGSCNVPCLAIPDTASLVDTTRVLHFPYDKTYDEAANDPVVYYHTSGTTGFPKPVLWTNTTLCLPYLGFIYTPELEGRPLHPHYMQVPLAEPRCRILVSMSAFHSSMALGLLAGVYMHKFLVFTPMHLPLPEYTPKRMTEFLQHSQFEHLVTFPARLEGALKDPDYADELRKLKYIMFGGAPISPEFGTLFAGQQVKLLSGWGATEVMFPPTFETDHEDWEYLCFHEEASGFKFQHFDTDRYELIVVRDDSLTKPPQSTFKSFPTWTEHHVKDLFTPHPTKKHHWKFVGRCDNNIILSVGQNINPEAFEVAIAKHPLVKSATMLGNGRPRPCLILELYSYENTEAQIDAIWPIIEEAFKGRAGYDVVQRSNIIVAKQDKPIPLNIKGGIKRPVLYTLYKEEMDACYTE